MDSRATQYTSFRWIVLATAWLAMVGVGWILFLTPALAYDLVPDLALTPTQLTLVFTAPVLMGTFVNIPGGGLGDRYGIRLVVGVAIGVAGLSTLAKAWVSNFGEMLALACVFGIAYGAAVPNLPKLVAVWFPRKEAGLASGIYMTAFAVGISVGLLTGSYFGGWRPAFLCTGIITTALALLWLLLGRSAPKGAMRAEMPSVTAGIRVAVKSKNIWLISLSFFILQGAYFGLSGNFPEALTIVHSISPKEAGAITSLLTFAGIPGSILIPMLSDRIGIRKPFVYVGGVAAAICYYLAWRQAPGVATYALLVIGSLVFSGAAPILLASLVDYPEVPQKYVGGASGLAMAAANAGGFLIPLLIITPLMAAQTASAYDAGFLTTVLLLCAGALVIVGLTETGARARIANRLRQWIMSNGRFVFMSVIL